MKNSPGSHAEPAPAFTPADSFPPAPSVKRRLACMLYEALLLFGVVFISGWLFDVLTQSRHALMLRHTRQVWLFLVIGAYFTFFWCRSGQTLAMKTWRIRLVLRDGGRVRLPQALGRYLLAWMLFLPALALDAGFGIHGWPSVGMIVVGMSLWLMTVRLDPGRQFLHDRLAGTRLSDLPRSAATPA